MRQIVRDAWENYWTRDRLCPREASSWQRVTVTTYPCVPLSLTKGQLVALGNILAGMDVILIAISSGHVLVDNADGLPRFVFQEEWFPSGIRQNIS